MADPVAERSIQVLPSPEQSDGMPELRREIIEHYLEQILGKKAIVLRFSPLGGVETSSKGFGYGTPIKIDYEMNSQRHAAVIHTVSPGPFGHEYMADRAQALLWGKMAFNHLPLHVRSLDVGGFTTAASNIMSLGGVKEFFLLTEYVEGNEYSRDFARLQNDGEISALDLARTDALCDYLVEIHQVPGPDAGLYLRHIRELVGHGECIMGLTDSYPPDHPFLTPRVLEEIEHLCLAWRWRLKHFTHRLRQVHGDFHPWNILFQSGVNFRVLDRSRGEYGDPANDVASLTLNYVFFSLQQTGQIEGAFAALFERFWNRYLQKSGDQEILDVIAPFYAFRGLVMASPVWYPRLSSSVRQKLIALVRAVLEAERFDPALINQYGGR